MKKFQFLFAVGLFATAVLAIQSCNKSDEDTTEAVKETRSVNYTVLVVDGQNTNTKSLNGLQGATVAVSVNGSTQSKTTDANGHAGFGGIVPGTVAVTVTMSGFTTVNYLVDLNILEYTDTILYDVSRNASTKIIVLPTTGSGMAKVYGNVLADFNDNLPTGPASTTLEEVDAKYIGITATISEDLFSLVNHSGFGKVLDITYESATFDATASLGGYSISLPASADGIDYSFSVDQFEYDHVQTIGANPALWRYIYSGSLSSASFVSGVTYYKDLTYSHP